MPLEPSENPYVSDVNPVWGVGGQKNASCRGGALQIVVWSPPGEVYTGSDNSTERGAQEQPASNRFFHQSTARGPGTACGHVNDGSSRCVLHDEATVWLDRWVVPVVRTATPPTRACWPNRNVNRHRLTVGRTAAPTETAFT